MGSGSSELPLTVCQFIYAFVTKDAVVAQIRVTGVESATKTRMLIETLVDCGRVFRLAPIAWLWVDIAEVAVGMVGTYIAQFCVRFQ